MYKFFIVTFTTLIASIQISIADDKGKTVPTTIDDQIVKPIIIPDDVTSYPIKFTRLVYDIEYESLVGAGYEGKACNKHYVDFEFTDKLSDTNIMNMPKKFTSLASKYNYNLPDAEGELFKIDTKQEIKYYVAARLVGLDTTLCLKNGNLWDGRPSYKGSQKLSIEWQVFDPVMNKIVYKKMFETLYQEKERTKIEVTSKVDKNDLITVMDDLSLALAIKTVLSDQEFYDVITQKPEIEEVNFENFNVKYTNFTEEYEDFTLANATNSVVTLSTGVSHGSGFIISNDGYILTNQHVVGNNESITVIFSNGLEIEGQIIRTSPLRDVALVKVPIKGLIPLPLKTDFSPIGTKVFAIGAPRDKQLQGSISSGIVSTYRKNAITKLPILQSDVIVNGGNSGGPLVNERNEVIAITVSKISDSEGISFFIPIDSALEKLSILKEKSS